MGERVPACGEEASQTDLAKLFATARYMMAEYGRYVQYDGEPEEVYEGLPVQESANHFEVDLSGEKLRGLKARLPQEAAVLRLGDEVGMAYELPYAAKILSGGYAAHNPVAHFSIPTNTSESSSRALFIEESFIEGSPDGTYTTARLDGDGEPGVLTHDECMALQTVLDMLPALL